MTYQEIKDNCWYLLDGSYYFVKKVIPEGIMLSSSEDSEHTWLRTGKSSIYFERNAKEVNVSEAKSEKLIIS
ncbi:hypothetical protein I6N95_05165 [Vagococcus sp. BWB3-3]|uniref:Uncharacterized protein n=1 Tax=Vagococcus allomyrinae TaxID=2794353 RepID=A0A940P3L3_9ENTE|nr:hypothetical protein [Vagococcus allomyrinae]MBP1040400.1 hypothetical protein [Vagococcus allomyrinae]